MPVLLWLASSASHQSYRNFPLAVRPTASLKAARKAADRDAALKNQSLKRSPERNGALVTEGSVHPAMILINGVDDPLAQMGFESRATATGARQNRLVTAPQDLPFRSVFAKTPKPKEKRGPPAPSPPLKLRSTPVGERLLPAISASALAITLRWKSASNSLAASGLIAGPIADLSIGLGEHRLVGLDSPTLPQCGRPAPLGCRCARNSPNSSSSGRPARGPARSCWRCRRADVGHFRAAPPDCRTHRPVRKRCVSALALCTLGDGRRMDELVDIGRLALLSLLIGANGA